MLGNQHVRFGGGESKKYHSNEATRRLPILHRGALIRYLEFEREGKLLNNVYYVDLGRPREGPIPHNRDNAASHGLLSK
ncbi:hypothetical protein KSC_072480 [Ktedonobacter sp. SOSP1-52]|nr:hypothetical protein KSC_072480 [Ktedonobacter sp. SOSP1-52]